jgi:phage baseplate assembly protein gpV
MSNRFYDAVSRIARHEAEAREVAAFGVVTEVHHKLLGQGDLAVSLELRDRGIVLPQVPVAVGALGVTAAPAVGDLVIVLFADADLHGAVVVGFLHHPDLPAPDLSAEQIALSLPPGAAVPKAQAVLDYAAPSLVLKIGSNTEVTIEDGAVHIASGGASIDIDAGGSEEVRVDTGGASLLMTAAGEVSIEAAQTLTLKATQIELKADATVTINGAIVDIN